MLRDPVAGRADIRQGLTAYQKAESALLYPYWLSLLAETYGLEGQPEAGLHILDEALSLIQVTGEQW
jgi:hypothetical protein